MKIHFRTFAIALTVLASASVAAQTPPDVRATSKNQRVDRAQQRCGLNRGVNCDTPEGLKEWLLLERSREEAVRDGSRHSLRVQPNRTPSRP